MEQQESTETTDTWPTSRIVKHILLPKPKGSPRAGRKEILLRTVTALILGAVAFAFFWGGDKTLPGCDQAETKTLLGKIINDLPVAKAVNAQFVSVKDVSDQGYNKAAGLRSCEGTLVTTRGEDGLQYSVRWQDKDRGTFIVEARLFNTDPSTQVAIDAVKQFEMARRNGTPIDVCTQAMMVSAAFLQAQDEKGFAKWKDVERQTCKDAGMPGY